VQTALAPVPHVILLKPSDRLEESLAILGERVGPEERAHVERLNWTFLANPSNARLATHTVLTGRWPVEALCEEVLALLA
jgi:hypothetical protein